MGHRRIVAAWVVLAGLTVSTGWAGDGAGAPPAPPAKDTLDAEVDAAHRWLGQAQWKQGADACQSLLRKYEGDPRVLARLDEIEEDLKVCTYRAQRKPLDGAAVLGRGVKSFNFSTRNVTFRFDARAIAAPSSAPGWSWDGDVAIFDVPMEGSISVEMKCSTDAFLRRDGDRVQALPLPACFLCFDTETRGGYVLSVAPTQVMGIENSILASYEGRLVRLGPDSKDLGKPHNLPVRSGGTVELTYSRSVTGSVSCSINGKKAAEATDLKYPRGLLGIATDRATLKELSSLLVTGRVETMYARRIESEAEGARWREWLDESWDRTKVLPAWLLAAERKLPPILPSDATPKLVAQVEPILPLVLRGDMLSSPLLRVIAKSAAKRTAAYLLALAAIADGDWVASDQYLAGLLADERTFGPAWVALVRSHMDRGDRDAARQALDDARAAAPGDPAIWDIAAAIELADGRLDEAQAALDEAARKGAVSPWARELRRVFLRMKRGPQWQRRFDFESAHYLVSSDTNLNTCMEVAKVLEEANASYKAAFRARPDGAKARVFVFAGMETYLDYAGDLGSDLSNTLGVYLPKLRQLCVFLHEDRRTLWNTVRHEGFHQYLHTFVEDAPDWFNEGYAEYFGFVRKERGKHVTGLVEQGEAAEVSAVAAEFTPLPEFFAMNHREFMEKAPVHYPQAWAVVHFLRETKDAALKGALDRFLDALAAGMPRKAAYDEVLAPLMSKIEAGFARHVRELGAR